MDSTSHPCPPASARARGAAVRLPFAAALLGLCASGCVAYAGPRPLPAPPAPMARDEAVQRAFDYAEEQGYAHLSLRAVRLEGALWEVLLRVKDPFQGRVMVSVDAYDGRVIKADTWQRRRHREDEDEDEDEHGGGRWRHGEHHDD